MFSKLFSHIAITVSYTSSEQLRQKFCKSSYNTKNCKAPGELMATMCLNFFLSNLKSYDDSQIGDTMNHINHCKIAENRTCMHVGKVEIYFVVSAFQIFCANVWKICTVYV